MEIYGWIMGINNHTLQFYAPTIDINNWIMGIHN